MQAPPVRILVPEADAQLLGEPFAIAMPGGCVEA
jgi:hypothetical protein